MGQTGLAIRATGLKSGVSEFQVPSCPLAGFGHVSHKLKPSATLVNSQLFCTRPVGNVFLVMLDAFVSVISSVPLAFAL